MWKEFKDFAMKGSVIDLAVGVIIGGAFGKIVTSLVGDIIMPIIAFLTSGVDFKDLKVTFGSVTLNYGIFIQNIVDFLIVAFTIFLAVKLINKARKKEEKKEEEEGKPPLPSEQQLLTEIRDLLKTQQSE